MGKFIDIEHLKEVLDQYPSSNSNKILNAIEEEFIYDENDIRSYMKIKSIGWLGWLFISHQAIYFAGISIGSEWQWYFTAIFFLGFTIALYFSTQE